MSMFHPLPKEMPFRAKAELMVKRGEARDFGHACSMMASRARKRAQQQPETQPMQARRLPYNEAEARKLGLKSKPTCYYVGPRRQ